MLQILSITLPQAKADNTPKELLNIFFFVSNQRKLQKKKKKKKSTSCYVGVLTTKIKIKQRKKVEKDKNDKNMS